MAAPNLSDDARSADGLVAKPIPGDNAEPLSVSELAGQLKRTVEDRFGFVRLRGELSGVKRAASGHLYACLKDQDAVIDGVMWKTSAARLAFLPEDGIEVIASGKVTTYPGRSKYQIVIDRMEIAGEGALLALLAKTRARLESEGLFANRRALPFLPHTIGVVTSPTGAVIRDILHRLADRFPSRVLIWPVPVQGQGAAVRIADAIGGFSTMPADGAVPRPDVLIVARGGGSIEDLWAFNEEVLVRAIAASTIPVISAVGHETDTTLADFAADLRAPTPTAAAELAVPVREDLANQIAELSLRQRRGIARPVVLGRERLDARSRALPRPDTLLISHTQRLDDLSERLRRGLSDRAQRAQGQLHLASRHLSLPVLRQRLVHASDRLARTRMTPALLERRLQVAHAALAPLARTWPQLDPDKPLQRGFARVTDIAGQTLTSARQAKAETMLVLKFSDDTVQVTVGTPSQAATPTPARKPRRAEAIKQGDLF